MLYRNSIAVGCFLALSGCSVFPPPLGVPCPIGSLQPSVTTFAEFTDKLNYCRIEPQAITSPSKEMIYIVPNEGDILYWFKDGRLTKITRRDPDNYNAWTNPIKAD